MTARARVGEELAALRADRSRAVVAGAALVGAVLRVAWVVVAARRPLGLYDPARYLYYAEAIGDGRGMVDPLTLQATAYFPPGYPWFLGVIEAVLVRTPLPDDLPLVAGLVQVLLGTASIVAAAVLARRLHSPAAGAVAAVVMAVYPNLILHTGTLLSETLAIALLLGLLVALVPPAATGPWPAGLAGRRLVAAGFLLGGLLLVRPVSAGVVGALAVSLLVARVGWRRAGAVLGVVVAVAVACVLPWTVRNALRLDAFVPISTNTGDNLCIGHGPDATGAFRLGAEDCATGTGVQDGIEGELHNDEEKTRRALAAIRAGWRDEPRLVWRRLVVTVERDDDAVRAVQSYSEDPWLGDRARALGRVADGAWWVVGPLGALGCLRLAASRRPDRLLVPLTVVGLFLAPLATFGDARFKVPAVPLLIVGVAAAVTRPAPGSAQEGGDGHRHAEQGADQQG